MRSVAYEDVARVELYDEVNQTLLDFAGPIEGDSIIDLGCGTGSMAAHLVARAGRPLKVWGVDPDPSMIESARAMIGDRVGLILGSAEDFGTSFPPGSIDAIFMANAIHLADPLPKAFAEIGRVLKPGGAFLFNTAFHDRADDPADRGLALQLVREARMYASEQRPDLLWEVGRRSAAKRQLNMDLYETLLRDAGLTLLAPCKEVTLRLPIDLVLKMLWTPVFAAGALPGVEPELAVEAMEVAAGRLQRSGALARKPFVNRTWLYAKAVKGT